MKAIMGVSVGLGNIVQRKWARVVVCGIACCASAASAGTQDGEKFVHIQPGSETHDWVYDEATGRVFASMVDGADAGAVVEFSPETGKELRRFAVGSNPYQLFVKGDVLAVSVRAGVALEFIDLTSNEITGKLKLEGKGPNVLFGSKVDNNLMYAICNTGTARWDGEVFQVDVKKRSVLGSTKVQRWRQSHAGIVEMSADGTRALLASVSGSPTGAALMEVNETKLTFRDLFNYHHSFGSKHAGPNNRFWTMGNGLWPLDLVSHKTGGGDRNYNPMREYGDSSLLALHARRDLCVGVKFSERYRQEGEQVMNFYSFGEAKRLTHIPLGKNSKVAEIHPARRINTGADFAMLTIDPVRDRVVFGNRNDAYIVDLKDLELPDDPVVVLTVPGTVNVPVGSELRLPLSLSNPEAAERAEYSIEIGPDGGNLEGGSLLWKPGSENVGINDLVVAVKVGESTDKARVRVIVERPSIEVGGNVLAMSLAPKGDRALVLTANAGVQTLILLDLDGRKELARRSFAKELSQILLTDDTGYYSPKGGAVLASVKLDDLSDLKRSFLESPAISLHRVPSKRIAVVTQGGSVLLDASTLAKVDGLPLPSRHFASISRVPLVDTLNDAVRFGQTVLDRESGDVLYELRNTSLVRDPVVSRRWNRRVTGRGLVAGTNTNLSEWENAPSLLLDTYPAAVTVRYSSTNDGNSRRVTAKVALDFRNLENGTRLPPVVLTEGPPPGDQGQSDPRGEKLKLKAAGDRVVVAYANRLFAVDFPAEALKALPIPLHFSNRVKAPELKVDQKEAVKFSASGGKAPLKYSLIKDLPGFTIDEKSGELTIDGATVWDAVQNRLKDRNSRSPSFFISPQKSGGATADHVWIGATLGVLDAENAKDVMPISFKLNVDAGVMEKLLQPTVAAIPQESAPGGDSGNGSKAGEAAAASPQFAMQVGALQGRLTTLEDSLEELTGKVYGLANSLEAKPEQGGAGNVAVWLLVALGALIAGTLLGRVIPSRS